MVAAAANYGEATNTWPDVVGLLGVLAFLAFFFWLLLRR